MWLMCLNAGRYLPTFVFSSFFPFTLNTGMSLTNLQQCERNVNQFTLEQRPFEDRKWAWAVESCSQRSTTWLQLSLINPKLLLWSTFNGLIHFVTATELC